MLKRVIVLCLAVSLFFSVVPGLSYAQEEAINEIGGVYTPRILPDSPWYIFKLIRDRFQLLLTRGEVEKAQLELEQINKRVLEFQQLCDIGKCVKYQKMADNFAGRMEKLEEKAGRLKNEGRNVEELVEKLRESGLKHQAVLQRVYERAPEPAKEAVLSAKERALRGLENAVEKLEGVQERQQVRQEVQQQMQEGLQRMKEEAVRERFQQRFESWLGGEPGGTEPTVEDVDEGVGQQNQGGR
ncbi:DUF5667 domain-containing protein [Candidatus Parcubacteria bacterium]|nr:DUF5667 domain-containing protein [Candidatus Parcubacteria bacterium]